MYKCTICGTLSSKQMTVCPRCNGTEIEQVSNNTNTEYTRPSPAPEYTYGSYMPYSVVYSKPASVGKIQAIISMVLGVEAIVTSLFMIMLSLFTPLAKEFLPLEEFYRNPFGDSSFFPYAGDMSQYIISIAISVIAASIASLCLASASRSRGNVSKLPTVGRILSIIAIGVTVVGLFVSFNAIV